MFAWEDACLPDTGESVDSVEKSARRAVQRGRKCREIENRENFQCIDIWVDLLLRSLCFWFSTFSFFFSLRASENKDSTRNWVKWDV